MEKNKNFDITLDNLPDDCLLYIIELLDTTSRYLLSLTCKRLANLVDLQKFWRIIDARQPPYNLEKANYCTDRITDETMEFYINHLDNEKLILPDDFFIKLKYHNLKILAIENQTIDCPSTMEQLTINDFPNSLEELSLKRTKLPISKRFFRHSSEHMTQLRVLILDECHWVDSSMFISFTKYKKLEILSVYKCCQIDDSVAYISLARFGFPKLKIFDGRLTRLGNTFMSTFSDSKSILAIYLQNQNVSYKLDYYKRQYELLENGGNIYNSDVNNEFSLDDKLIDEFNTYDPENSPVTDSGLVPYQECVGSNDRFELPKSILYKDPYKDECTCGYSEAQNHKLINYRNEEFHQLDDSDSDDDDDDDDDDLHKILFKKIKKLTFFVESSLAIRGHSFVLYNQNYPKYPGFVINQSGNVKVIRISFVDNNSTDNNYNDGPPRKRQRTEQSNENNCNDNYNNNDNNQANPGPSRQQNNYPLVRILDLRVDRERKSIPIRRLSLRGHQGITNISLNCLKELNLELLDLTYTRVTSEGIGRFLHSNPNCRILHSEYCRCSINLHF